MYTKLVSGANQTPHACWFLERNVVRELLLRLRRCSGLSTLALTGATMCIPLLNTIVTHRTPIEYRGRLLGTTSAASSWGRVAGPLIAGFNLGVFGYGGAYLGSAAVVSVYLVWALHEYRQQRAKPPGNVQRGA